MFPIQFSIKISYKDFYDFFRFSTNKKKHYKRIPLFLFALFMLYIVLIYRSLILMDYESVGYYSFIFMLLIGYYLWYILLVPKSAFKSLSLVYSFENTYSFEEDKYSIKIDTDAYKELIESKYYVLFQAFLTEKYLYLYTQKNAAHIIPLASLSGEQVDALRGVLRRHLASKFIDYSN